MSEEGRWGNEKQSDGEEGGREMVMIVTFERERERERTLVKMEDEIATKN